MNNTELLYGIGIIMAIVFVFTYLGYIVGKKEGVEESQNEIGLAVHNED